MIVEKIQGAIVILCYYSLSSTTLRHSKVGMETSPFCSMTSHQDLHLNRGFPNDYHVGYALYYVWFPSVHPLNILTGYFQF